MTYEVQREASPTCAPQSGSQPRVRRGALAVHVHVALHHLVEGRRRRLEVAGVASSQGHHQPRRALQPADEPVHECVPLLEARGAELEPADPVRLVRVDAALKEDQVRLRRLEEPWQVLAQQREIAVVALPHRHVHVEVRRLACREEVALAMLRVGLHAPVGGKDARAAVPLVHVQVDQQHSPDGRVVPERARRGDGDVVEDAVPLAPVCKRVVRPARDVACEAGATRPADGVHRRHGPTRRRESA
mmetsp:Transcript_31766/g.101937  ORF Transcript_31766/g.101937 Transcript_31766/m.101937 type:complete len:246 (+) Transcript_31766:28-765(+)